MCLNCGCGLLDEPHDRSENIITEDLRRAAAANGQTLEETAANLVTGASRLAGRDPGRPASSDDRSPATSRA